MEALTTPNNWKTLSLISKDNITKVYKIEKEDGKIAVVKKLSLPINDADAAILMEKGKILFIQDATNYYLEMMNNEISILNQLSNEKNILVLYETIEEKKGECSDYYLIMEYAEDITNHFKNNKISESDVVKLAIDICSALESCKKINVIHNDIKPNNIFFDGTNYKLGDFGNSSIGGSNNIVTFGTPNYLPPEVAQNKTTNETSDLYSLGLVMYKLLTGHLPFVDSETDEQTAYEKRLNGSPILVDSSINLKLMNIILKACSFEIKNRYQTASEMKKELSQLTDISNKKKDIIITTSKLDDTISVFDSSLIASQTKAAKSISAKKKKAQRNDFLKKNLKRGATIAMLFILFFVSGIIYMLNRDCESGFINKNGLCVKGYYFCSDEGYVLNEKNQCQKTIDSKNAKVSYSCQQGFTLKDDVCVNTEIIEPTSVYKCADSFRLNGKKCEREESIDAVVSYTCPKGYVSAGDKCVTVSNIDAEARYICSDTSYTLKGNVCSKKVQKTESAAVTYSCNSGGTLKETKCEYISTPTYSSTTPSYPNWGWGTWGGTGTQTPTCSSGYTYSSTDQKCHKTENAKIRYTCPSGTTNNNNGTCTSTVTEQKNAIVKYTCPSGYTPVGAQCAKSTNISGKIKYNCPDDTKLRDKKCVSTITSDAINMYICPEGYIVSGSGCIMEEYPQAIKKYSCSRVYTLNGDKCEKYSTKPAQAVYTE